MFLNMWNKWVFTQFYLYLESYAPILDIIYYIIWVFP